MQLVDFLVNYWQYLLAGVMFILNIIIIFVRRRPKTWDEFINELGKLIYWVPEAVSMAELLKDASGNAKKDDALSHLLDILEERLGRELTLKELRCFQSCMSGRIEAILACPTKKGGQGREKDE